MLRIGCIEAWIDAEAAVVHDGGRPKELWRECKTDGSAAPNLLTTNHQRAQPVLPHDRWIERSLSDQRARLEEIGRIESQRGTVADVDTARFQEHPGSDLAAQIGFAEVVADCLTRKERDVVLFE